MEHRENQINEIKSVLDSEIQHLFITGLQSTGKTFVLKSTLKESLEDNQVAWIDCYEIVAPRILYERALSRWTGKLPKDISKRVVDSTADFAFQMEANLDPEERLFLVLDNADQLLSLLSPVNFAALLKLPEKTELNLCIIMISHLKWDSFIGFGTTIVPRTILFPVYSREETIDILTLDCPAEETIDFYKAFLTLVYDSHQHACKDLVELQYLVKNLFPKYIEPVVKGNVDREETTKLFKQFKSVIKESIASLYLRQISSLEWNESLSTKVNYCSRIEIPRLTRFLVIAGYLASYNPAKLDIRYFSKGAEPKKRVSKKAAIHNGTKLRQQLKGPKTFPLERMLGIFYSIVDENVKSTFDIHTQIATCFALKLLIRTSQKNNLDVISCKANVSYSLVKELGHSVNFDVAKYLFDFIDS